uniref:Malic enzyme n=1 Tax=Campylaephora kondoi TaxID=218449 RepID=A0A097IUG5_9FLOR|nr:malic enzyme [Campylaephora kondoi]
MSPTTTSAPSTAPPPHPVLANAALNRGRRFADADRAALGVDALVPSGPARSLREEVARLLAKLASLPTPILRYECLLRLASSDEELFFAAAQTNFAHVLPLIYTPTVGEACVTYPSLDIPPRGLWLSHANHAGRIEQTLRAAWPRKASVIVVSDCQRILGLGDLGANGMPIPVGKLLLYTACGGVPPADCLPVVLDVGCDVDAVRDAPDYIGTRAPRITGEAYDAFVDEFITAVARVYGQSCLVQFEDFGNANAMRLLRKYRDDVCCFNDDVQGTAAVGLAGVLAALRMHDVPTSIADHSFLFLGAGSAGLGIAELLVLALRRAGLSEADARKRCWFVDSRGLVYAGRERVSGDKLPFAHDAFPAAVSAATGGLAGLVDVLKPTALIGVSTQPGSFAPEVIAKMAEHNKRPLVFALSNPTSKSECTAEEAYKHSDGRAVFASGSPFARVELNGRTFVPGQGNNSYVFPGLGLGVLVSGARVVPDSMLLAAADRLASLVDQGQLDAGCVYPDPKTLMDISANIAHAVCDEAVKLGVNTKDVADVTVQQIRERMYEPGRGRM